MAEAGDELATILAECLERRQRGEVVDRSALMGRHPDLARRLRSCFALSDFIDETVEEFGSDLREDMPETIDDYRLVREIGRGGMGVVYEAIQVSMERRVALKVLSRSFGRSKDAVLRFRREIRVAGRLHHPNIVPIYATGRYQGLWYYAMERIDGMPLQRLLTDLGAVAAPNEQATGAPEAVALLGLGVKDRGYCERIASLFAGVAEALEVAHGKDIVHRDIKPSNLLLDTNGILRVVDFGLAQLGKGGGLTLTGTLLGTPTYMSPEQAMAKRLGIDHRTDIYSVGATLYEALTLEPPYCGDSIHEICAQIVTADLRPPRRLNRTIPTDLETIVLKAMAKDRGRRYATAGELAADLQRFARGEEIRARRPALASRLWRKAMSNRAGIAIVLLVMAVAALGWGMTRGWGRATEVSAPAIDARTASEVKRIRAAKLAQDGKGELAIATWKEAIALDPTNHRAYLQAGDYQRNTVRLEGAFETYSALLRVAESSRAYYGIAGVLRRQGHLDRALEACDRAIEIRDDIGYRRQRVHILLKMRKFEESLAASREAIAKCGHAPRLRYLELTLLRALGRTSEARERAVAGVKEIRRHPRPQYAAYFQAAAGQGDQARKTLEGIPAKNKPFLRAIVFAVLGDKEQLRHWLEFDVREHDLLTPDESVYLEFERFTEDPVIEQLLSQALGRVPAGANRRR